MTENHTTQHFSNLCISSPNSPPPPPPHHHHHNHPPCSLCGCPITVFSSPLKRKNMAVLDDQETPSTDDHFHILEPKSKRAMFLDHLETPSPPPFLRSVSDPLPPRSTPEPPFPFPRSVSDPLPPRSVPENPIGTSPAAKLGGFDYSSLPLRHPSSALLRRTNSDDAIVSSPDKNCSLCGCPTISSPMKVASPETSTDFNFNEPRSKRLGFLDPQEPPSSSPFPGSVSDPLHQRKSSPAAKGGFDYSAALPPRPPPFRRNNSDLSVSSPSTPESSPAGFDYSALPPRSSPSFRRTNSNPIVTSPSPAPANTMSLSASYNHERPNHKDLAEESESETMSLEEKNGDIFVDLRCPCGETYAIIFSGQRVYYKVYHVHH